MYILFFANRSLILSIFIEMSHVWIYTRARPLSLSSVIRGCNQVLSRNFERDFAAVASLNGIVAKICMYHRMNRRKHIDIINFEHLWIHSSVVIRIHTFPFY